MSDPISCSAKCECLRNERLCQNSELHPQNFCPTFGAAVHYGTALLLQISDFQRFTFASCRSSKKFIGKIVGSRSASSEECRLKL